MASPEISYPRPEKNIVGPVRPEILINFILNTKCRCNLILRSVSFSFPVAFKVQTSSSPHKFLVNPQSGLVPPSSHVALQIVLKPQDQIPTTHPLSLALIPTVSSSGPSRLTLTRASPLTTTRSTHGSQLDPLRISSSRSPFCGLSFSNMLLVVEIWRW
ncbi:Major sperm protein [Corchorus olitorius]|uniref:Major sperm protein n=1 Tax=Corchorus olitorius TaxID=93759 RepID=A0A1R3GY52_9ROSI|nr:Major sperm protein [Corchorus olitorius]